MTDKLYEFLTKPVSIRRRMKNIDSQIEGLRASMLPKAITYDSDKIQFSGSGDPMANFVVKLEELEEEKAVLAGELIKAQDAVVDAANRIDDSYGGTIVVAKYIAGKNFTQILDEDLMLTESTMFRHYKEAIKELEVTVNDSE